MTIKKYGLPQLVRQRNLIGKLSYAKSSVQLAWRQALDTWFNIPVCPRNVNIEQEHMVLSLKQQLYNHKESHLHIIYTYTYTHEYV